MNLSIPHCSSIVVVSVCRAIRATLMMKGHSVRLIISRPVHARATSKVLMHLRLWAYATNKAWTTGKISIAADRCKGSASSEIVVRNRVQCRNTCSMSVIRAACTVAEVRGCTVSSTTSCAASSNVVVVAHARYEGRGTRVGTSVGRNDAVAVVCVCGFPIYRLKTCVALG